jgi:hypothetical protein
MVALYWIIGSGDYLSGGIDAGRLSRRRARHSAQVSPNTIAVEVGMRGSAVVEVNRASNLTRAVDGEGAGGSAGGRSEVGELTFGVKKRSVIAGRRVVAADDLACIVDGRGRGLKRPLWVAKTPSGVENVDFSIRCAKVGPSCSSSLFCFSVASWLASNLNPGSCLRIWRCGINWLCSNVKLANPNPGPPTVCFGLACGAFGHIGNKPCCSSNPKPSSPGIALVFACSGAGKPEHAQEDPLSMVSSSR